MISSFYSQVELQTLGLKSYGNNIFISKKVSIYNPGEISMCDNVRIDDFCILSGNIEFGSHIHISAYCALYAKNGIVLENYTGLSPRVTLLSATDDFSGNYLIGPMVSSQYTNVTGKKIMLKTFVQIGASSVILPGVCINEGSCVGAMSLVNKDLESWGIYAGIPVRRIMDRTKKLIELAELNEKDLSK